MLHRMPDRVIFNMLSLAVVSGITLEVKRILASDRDGSYYEESVINYGEKRISQHQPLTTSVMHPSSGSGAYVRPF
jgi:hypothetical protein